jgi:hypothetical protein
MFSKSFRSYFSPTACLSMEKQQHLLRVVGSPDWSADLHTGTITLGAHQFPIQLLDLSECVSVLHRFRQQSDSEQSDRALRTRRAPETPLRGSGSAPLLSHH